MSQTHYQLCYTAALKNLTNLEYLVPMDSFELSTLRLSSACSASELHRQIDCSGLGARTLGEGPLFNSPLTESTRAGLTHSPTNAIVCKRVPGLRLMSADAPLAPQHLAGSTGIEPVDPFIRSHGLAIRCLNHSANFPYSNFWRRNRDSNPSATFVTSTLPT